MSAPGRPPRLLFWSLVAAGAGLLSCLVLFVKETPYTLTAFMFLGQPLLLIGFGLYIAMVVSDLKRKELI